MGWRAHPYTLNVLSSLTGFAASGLFASLVLETVRRARYRDVELNRRTQALNEIDAFLRSLAEAFASTGYGADAAAALAAQSHDVATAPAVEDEQIASALSARVAQTGLSSSAAFPDGSELAARFAFIGDNRIELLGDRLDRKSRDLRLSLAEVTSARVGARCAVDAYERAAEVAATAVEVRTWLYDAPSKWMRRAVQQRAYRSDL